MTPQEQEWALIGSLMLADPEAIDKAAEHVSPACFISPGARRMWQAMAACRKTDPATVRSTLSQQGLDSDDAVVLILRALNQDLTGVRWVVSYAERVSSDSRRRQQVAALCAAVEAANEGDGESAVLEHVQDFHDALEQGRPAPLREIDMARLMEAPPEVPWLAEGIFGRTDICLLAGESGAGKSVLAADLAVAAATGTPWMGAIPIIGGPYRVLYVDEEMAAELVAQRLAALCRGRKIDDTAALPIRYLVENSLTLDSHKMRSRLEAEIEHYQPQLVIFDAIMRFHRGQENDNSAMGAFLQDCLKPLRQRYSCAVVPLHHFRKPSDDDDRDQLKHRIRGAGDFFGFCDSVVVVHGSAWSPRRTLTPLKCRWLPVPDQERQVEYDEPASGVATLSARTVQVDAENLVLNFLRDMGPAGALRQELKDWLAASGYSKESSSRKLSDVMRKLSEASLVRRAMEDRQARYWLAGEAPVGAG